MTNDTLRHLLLLIQLNECFMGGAGVPFEELRLDTGGRLRKTENTRLPNAAGVSSLMAAAMNTLTAPPLTLQQLRVAQETGSTFAGTEVLIRNDSAWQAAHVLMCDADFTEVCSLGSV